VLWGLITGLEQSPLTPIQVLYCNLICAVTLGFVLAVEPAEKGIMKNPPRKTGKRIIGRFLLLRIAIGTIVLVATTVGSVWWIRALNEDPLINFDTSNGNIKTTSEGFDQEEFKDLAILDIPTNYTTIGVPSGGIVYDKSEVDDLEDLYKDSDLDLDIMTEEDLDDYLEGLRIYALNVTMLVDDEPVDVLLLAPWNIGILSKYLPLSDEIVFVDSNDFECVVAKFEKDEALYGRPYDIERQRAQASNTLTFGAISICLSARFAYNSGFSKALLHGNKYCWISVAIVVILQLLLTYVPGLNDIVFGMRDMDGTQWGIVVLFMFIVFCVMELEKSIRRRLKSQGVDTDDEIYEIFHEEHRHTNHPYMPETKGDAMHTTRVHH